jgi:hypothetical protein
VSKFKWVEARLCSDRPTACRLRLIRPLPVFRCGGEAGRPQRRVGVALIERDRHRSDFDRYHHNAPWRPVPSVELAWIKPRAQGGKLQRIPQPRAKIRDRDAPTRVAVDARPAVCADVIGPLRDGAALG